MPNEEMHEMEEGSATLFLMNGKFLSVYLVKLHPFGVEVLATIGAAKENRYLYPWHELKRIDMA